MPRKVDLDWGRLCQALQRDRLALRMPREERREFVREYVGRHWSEEGSPKVVYENLISLYVSIVGKQLIPQNPRALLSTFNAKYKPVVAAEQSWVNQEIERIRFQKTLQRVVVDALFNVGVCKVALAKPSDAAVNAWKLAAGAPFVTRVDLDDFVFDTRARDFEEVAYIGHRVRVPLDAIRDNPMYSKERKDLDASPKQPINLEGDERVSALGETYVGDHEDFEDMVDLWEIYIPRHGLVVTLPDDRMTGASAGSKDGPLLVQRWVGPDTGPYHILGYGIVPGNVMPKSPIQDIFDLHMAANRSWRKAVSGVDRLKDVTAVQQGGAEDAGRVVKANDGEIIQVNNPQALKQILMGQGAIQTSLLMAQTLSQAFSKNAGNLDMLGGLSPQAKTATQDELLAQNASKTITDMQETTVFYTAGVLKSLIWFHHHDPLRVQKTAYSPKGLPDLGMERHIYPNNPDVHQNAPGSLIRNAPWEELDVRVDPYSMQAQTPQSRLQAMNTVVTQIVIPMMQILTEAGVQFDASAYLKKVGEFMDMPDLADILTIGEPPADPEGSGNGTSPDSGPAPAQTKRTYERVSRPGATQQGTTQNLVQKLMGTNPGGNAESANGVPQKVG